MTKIKICGLRRMEDILAVNERMPEYVGFVFAESRRQVTLETATELSRRLRPEICPVGVYVDADTEEILTAVGAGAIRMVQLHGHETPSQAGSLKKRLPPGIPVMKAVRMEPGSDLTAWAASDADYLLLDAGTGGTGQTFDHSLLSGLAAAGIGGRTGKPWFLAGGMNPDNAPGAVRRYAPYGIDVSSGVETNGYKDPMKIEMMIRSVRNE